LIIETMLIVFVSLSSSMAVADCSCICVDGLNRPLCSEVTDVEPVCPPKLCPETPPGKPLEPYRLPPSDARTCSMKYLYNKYSERYEWRQVCH